MKIGRTKIDLERLNFSNVRKSQSLTNPLFFSENI